jgi:hypothetical protein
MALIAYSCYTLFLCDPPAPFAPKEEISYLTSWGQKGHEGQLFPKTAYYHARALKHHPLPPRLPRVQFIVAVPANLPPRTRSIQFELLFRQLPPTIRANHTR